MDSIPEPQTKLLLPRQRMQVETATLAIVRSELNLEKWSIWLPANSRLARQDRVIEREVTLPDGSRVNARVEVLFTTRGSFTTEDQKVYYALIKLWEEAGRGEEPVTFSLRQVAKVLRRTWGTKVMNSLIASLVRLRVNGFVWENSYYDGTTKETVRLLDTFTILGDLKVARRDRDGKLSKEAGTFRFNDYVLKNLRANHTKPVVLDTILGFQTEIAQMLYTHLDLVLAGRARYERRTKELFEDLGLIGTEYGKQSVRLRRLEPALRELEGARLSTGRIVAAGVERTADDTDYKIVIQKGRVSDRSLAAPADRDAHIQPSLPFAPPPEVPADVPSGLPDTNPPDAARAQVACFYEAFHGSGATARPTSRETALAREHLERLGEAGARHLVEFAHREAQKTRFAVQNYAGIAQYEGRAQAAFKADEKAAARTARKNARQSHQERFCEAYHVFLAQQAAEGVGNPTLEAFRSEEKRLLAFHKTRAAKSAKSAAYAEAFYQAEERGRRLAEFLAKHADTGLPTFWEWDAAHNPQQWQDTENAPSRG